MKKYLDLTNGYPVGENIKYRCNICEDEFFSLQKNAVACKCRNLIIDADSGRISVKNINQVVAFFEDE